MKAVVEGVGVGVADEMRPGVAVGGGGDFEVALPALVYCEPCVRPDGFGYKDLSEDLSAQFEGEIHVACAWFVDSLGLGLGFSGDAMVLLVPPRYDLIGYRRAETFGQGT